jgi:hypothetical protein
MSPEKKSPPKGGRGRRGYVLPLSPSSVARSTRLSSQSEKTATVPPLSPSQSPDSVAHADRLAKRLGQKTSSKELPPLPTITARVASSQDANESEEDMTTDPHPSPPPPSPDSVARAERVAKRSGRKDLTPTPPSLTAPGPLNLDDSLASAQDASKVKDPPELCSLDRGPTQLILGHSELRDFEYPVRIWSIVERPPPLVVDGNEDVDGGEGYEDPYHDFPTEDWDPPKIQPNVGGFYLEEILNAIEKPAWLKSDYISFYTKWSQRGRGQYDDDSDMFSVYFPSGDQARLYGFFNSRRGDWTWDTPDIRRKCIVACWKLFHPGSYYLWVGEKIAANPTKYTKLNTNRFRELRATLGSVPLTFNVFKKRVISFIVCNDAHYVPYFACNLGASVTRMDKEVSHDRPNSFIVELDSQYDGIGDGMTNFFYFVLEIARHLEIWVANYLTLKVGDPLPDLDFDAMAAGAREMVKNYKSPLCDISIVQPHQRPRQNDDLNCGPFASLNVYAVFQAEKEHFVRLDNITSPEKFFDSIIRPFWNLSRDEEADPQDPETKRLLKLRATSFRTYLLDIMLAKFHHISDTRALSPWGVLYLLEHQMETFVPSDVLEYLLEEFKKGPAPPTDTTEARLNKQLEEMIKRNEGKEDPVETESLNIPDDAAGEKAAATPAAEENLPSEKESVDLVETESSASEKETVDLVVETESLNIPDDASGGKAAATPAAKENLASEKESLDLVETESSASEKETVDLVETESSTLARLKIPEGAAEGKAAATPSAQGELASETETDRKNREVREILELRDRLKSSKKATSPTAATPSTEENFTKTMELVKQAEV